MTVFSELETMKLLYKHRDLCLLKVEVPESPNPK